MNWLRKRFVVHSGIYIEEWSQMYVEGKRERKNSTTYVGYYGRVSIQYDEK